MKKIFVLVSLFLVFASSVFAFESIYNYTENLTDKEIATLMSGDYIEARTNWNQDVFRLAVPNSNGFHTAYEASKAEHSFTVGVLQFIAYPDSVQNLSDEEKMLDVYNRMLKISTLKGVEYKSHRAGEKYKTLFSDACMIKGPKSTKAVDDPCVDAVPSSVSYYACLTDTKFGNNIYVANYTALEDEICIEITNDKPIKYFGAKCVDAKDLHMYVDVKFAAEGISVFGFAVAYDTDVDVKVLFTTVSLDGAFITRIKAMKDWFVASMQD